MQPRTKYLSAFALISVVLVGVKSGFVTRSHVINVLLFFSCFVAYAYIAFGAFALRPRLLGWGMGSLLSLPIAISILASPLVLFGVFWAFSDFAAGPDTVIHMADGLLCEEYSSGSVVTEANETFELDRPVLGLFLLRLAVETGPVLENYSVQKGCASVDQTWKSSNRASTM
ncbi:hypothetical protein [Paraburkholderia sp. SUR17]|uniref:hypothetical protein n=1 Tax=Paraburkholderia sp. SUR17 TaxID=3034358 RepID=UPI0024080E6B|nr:hypothetical protein [Paraburkholderia sp. SUR17]WEY42090.1 hypothetical protein P2869_18675 [Paraburkholderia sp. SUR17]